MENSTFCPSCPHRLRLGLLPSAPPLQPLHNLRFADSGAPIGRYPRQVLDRRSSQAQAPRGALVQACDLPTPEDSDVVPAGLPALHALWIMTGAAQEGPPRGAQDDSVGGNGLWRMGHRELEDRGYLSWYACD